MSQRDIPAGGYSIAADGTRSIDREIEHDYVLERLGNIREIVADLLDNGVVEPPRFDHVPQGGASALEGIAAAVYAAERLWTR